MGKPKPRVPRRNRTPNTAPPREAPRPRATARNADQQAPTQRDEELEEKRLKKEKLLIKDRIGGDRAHLPMGVAS